jgi:hypothetical protein
LDKRAQPEDHTYAGNVRENIKKFFKYNKAKLVREKLKGKLYFYVEMLICDSGGNRTEESSNVGFVPYYRTICDLYWLWSFYNSNSENLLCFGGCHNNDEFLFPQIIGCPGVYSSKRKEVKYL